MSHSQTVSQNTPMGLSSAALIGLYRQMVLLRQFELTAQKCYRSGEMPGFIHLYIGQEATGVGICAHLQRKDWITSTHRGHGHALAKGVPAEKVLAELYGKATGCCGGRGGSMHLYSPDCGLFGTNGFVGGGIPSTVGLGMSAKIRRTGGVAVSFFGDGAVNHGAFHEAVNFAGAQDAPVIFVCENNLYATATPLTMTTRNTDVASKAAAYGIPGVAVDGNDVLAVWQAMQKAVERARSGAGPTLIEARTYRFVGHHEGDPLVGTYRTQEELDAWGNRCPIANFKQKLLEEEIATPAELAAIDEEIAREMEATVKFARESPQPDPATATFHSWADPINPPMPETAPGASRTQGWLEAVRDGIAEEMRRDPHIVYMGEGTGERGGSFAHTKNLWQEFGAERMIDTPICELGFTGAGVGLAASGCRAVADLMITDFIFEAGTQIVHQAAKLRYMSNGQIGVPLIVRSMYGTIKSTGPHHSGSYYPAFGHCPGLIVAIPSTPADAKGMFKTALRASDPVLFFEHKALLATKGPVPEGDYLIPFGQAAIVREGSDLTIVSCGLMVHRSLDAAKQLQDQDGVSCEVIDLRTIVPLDVETVARSLSKTGRLLVADEAFAMFGLGAEIAASMMEHAFDEFDAPMGRVHIDPVASPFSPALEAAVLPTVEKIIAGARAVLNGTAPHPLRANGAASNGHVKAPSSAAQDGKLNPLADGPARVNAAPRAQGVPLRMPNQDLTITEATIVRWVKQVGDAIKAGDVVVEAETDKAIVEIESEIDGRLVEILAEVGATVALNEQLATIEPAAS